MYCIHCGNQLSDDATVCSQCGALIDKPSIIEDKNIKHVPVKEETLHTDTAEEKKVVYVPVKKYKPTDKPLPTNNISIISLVLGICGIIRIGSAVSALLMSVAALVLGIIGFVRYNKGKVGNNGVTIAAFVVSIIAVVISIDYVVEVFCTRNYPWEYLWTYYSSEIINV